MTVKLLAVDYEKVNERGVFSPGDVLSGKVTLVTSKEIKVQCFSVKAKGRAKVTWCEREGRSGLVRSGKKRYFHLEHIILQDKNKGDGRYHRLSDKVCAWKTNADTAFLSPQNEVQKSSVLEGTCILSHLWCQICAYLICYSAFLSSWWIQVTFLSGLLPPRDMPSSYDGKWGNVTYSVRAKLTQSIWLVHKAGTDFPFLTKSEFPFASKTEMMIIGLKVCTWFPFEPVRDVRCHSQILTNSLISWTGQEQQQATRISFYGSDKITINVTSEKMGVKQGGHLHSSPCLASDKMTFIPTGEALGVSLEVVNDSARTVTPRFYLCEKQTFAAQSARMVHTDNVLFGTGECVPAQASRTITKVLSVPPDLPPTFFNCCLMKLEYRLKVLLPTQTEL